MYIYLIAFFTFPSGNYLTASDGAVWVEPQTLLQMTCSVDDPFVPTPFLSFVRKSKNAFETAPNGTSFTVLAQRSNTGDRFECEAVSDASRAANLTVNTSMTLHVAEGPMGDPVIEFDFMSEEEVEEPWGPELYKTLKVSCSSDYYVNPFPPMIELFIDGVKIDGDTTVGYHQYSTQNGHGWRKTEWMRHGVYPDKLERSVKKQLIIKRLNWAEHQGKIIECRVKNRITQFEVNQYFVLADPDGAGAMRASLMLILANLIFASIFFNNL